MKSKNTKIKILYEIHPSIVGGIEIFFHHLLTHIDRNRFEPIAISYRLGKPLSLFSSLNISTEVIPPKNGALDFQKLLKIIKHYQPEIIQSNYYNAWMAITSHIAHIPHLWYIGGHIDVALSHLNQQQKGECLNAIDHFSNRIICPSEFIRKQFDPVIKNRSKVKVIYHGTNLPIPENNGLQKKDFLNGCVSIAMIGHFTPQKQHVDFILAAKKIQRQFPKSKFFIFGINHHTEPERQYMNHLRKTIDHTGLTKQIIFAELGNDPLSIIQKMNLTVLPSINEGGSLAMIEAMTAGKPIVASSSGANPEYIENGITGLLVPPKNPQKLADAAIRILSNEKEMDQMGKAGRKRAEELFNITTCARKYEDLYETIHQENNNALSH